MLSSDCMYALLGGALIGLAAAGMMWSNGRVMGVSGIVGSLLFPKTADRGWRVLFLAGLVMGSFFISPLGFTVMELPFDRSIIASVLGGILVGAGTSLGSGCTSGHGVCGISRLSPRSLVATAVFMIFGIASVALLNRFVGTMMGVD